MPSEVCRRCLLCQISRYSKIALASSMRVRLQETDMRLVEVRVLAGEDDDAIPEVLVLIVAVKPAGKIVGLADVHPAREQTRFSRPNQQVDARAIEIGASTQVAVAGTRSHERLAGPVALLDDPHPVGLASSQKDPDRSAQWLRGFHQLALRASVGSRRFEAPLVGVEVDVGSMYADAEAWRTPTATDAMSVPLWLS